MNRLNSFKNIIIFLIVTALLSGCGSQQQETSGDIKPLKVVYTTPVSGPFAATGQNYDAAVKIAAEDFNKESQVPIELVFEDAGSTPVTAKNALNKLLETNPSSIIANTLSVQYPGIMPTLEQKKIATIVVGSSPTIFENGWDWIFGTTPTNAVEGGAGLKYLNEKLGKTKISLVVYNNDIGDSIIKALSKVASEKNVTLFPEFYQPGDNDFTGNITSAKRKNPDSYIIIGNAPDSSKIIRQMKQLGIQEPIMSHVASYSDFLKLLDAKELEGLYGWSAAIPPQTNPDPMVQAFNKRFNEQTGLEPDGTTLYVYDGAMMLFNAVVKAEGDSQKIIEYMHSTQGYEGLGGTYSYDSKGRGRKDTNIIQIGPDKTIKVLENMQINIE